MQPDNKQQYIVTEVISETESVRTLRIARADGTEQPFTPGQFITVYFPESKTPEGKAYSLSYTPQEGLAITVKAIGEFSNQLCAKHSGDTILASAPYGYFAPERGDSDLVLVAAGIGITPFRNIIKHTLAADPTRSIRLFYSTKTNDDIVFCKEFEALERAHPNFTWTHFLTQQSDAAKKYLTERMTPEKILQGSNSEKCEYLLCGSISFVRDLWRGLRALGVSEESIYTEAFFS